jgi:hypothetical protein
MQARNRMNTVFMSLAFRNSSGLAFDCFYGNLVAGVVLRLFIIISISFLCVCLTYKSKRSIRKPMDKN